MLICFVLIVLYILDQNTFMCISIISDIKFAGDSKVWAPIMLSINHQIKAF